MNNCETLTIVINKGLSSKNLVILTLTHFFYHFFVSIMLFFFFFIFFFLYFYIDTYIVFTKEITLINFCLKKNKNSIYDICAIDLNFL